MVIRLKRVYEPASSEDGVRVLVDRLWPRGIKKDHLQVDHWLKDIAPSPELRTWFCHDPAKFDAFREHYRTELLVDPTKQVLLQQLAQYANETNGLTLVYAARDPVVNHVVVLRDVLVEWNAASQSSAAP